MFRIILCAEISFFGNFLFYFSAFNVPCHFNLKEYNHKLRINESKHHSVVHFLSKVFFEPRALWK